jgi:hypothetical protein
MQLSFVDLHSKYYALETKFSPQHFCIFLELIEHVHDALCLTRTELAYIILCVIFFGGKLFMLHCTIPKIWVKKMVTKEVWVEITNLM